MVVQEMATIATECAIVLRILGDSMKNMKKFASENIMRRAEEAAVALQYKIHKNTDVLLGGSESESLAELLSLETPPQSAPSIEQPFLEQDDLNTTIAGGKNNGRPLAWQEIFLHRKSSLGLHWDGTLERISALSLVKFASLLIEVVSKMRYVVDCVEDLTEQAKFQACD